MNELKELLKLSKKFKVLLISLLVLGGLGATIISSLIPTKYIASTTLYIGREPQKPGEDYYTYDGFYSQQASREYTDTVVGLLKTSDIYRSALEKLETKDVSASEFLSSANVRKVSPQVISVSVTREDREEANKFLVVLSQTVAEKSKSLNQLGDKNFFVGTVNAQPLVTISKVPTLLNGLVGALLGLVVGMALVALYQYLRVGNKE
jgi:capsular polysaccharide biosynthesis protein